MLGSRPVESPSMEAWRMVRGDVFHDVKTVALAPVLALAAWWLPRWVLPTLWTVFMSLCFHGSIRSLLESLKRWKGIRSDEEARRLRRLVDDVHDF